MLLAELKEAINKVWSMDKSSGLKRLIKYGLSNIIPHCMTSQIIFTV